jgi:hypothetical protein
LNSGARRDHATSIPWEAVVDPARAISAREGAATFGYNLPVRSVFGKLHQGRRAATIEKELRQRALVAPTV